MFNNYYEDVPVGYKSITSQKETLGVIDNTYIEFGKGVVKPTEQNNDDND